MTNKQAITQAITTSIRPYDPKLWAIGIIRAYDVGIVKVEENGEICEFQNMKWETLSFSFLFFALNIHWGFRRNEIGEDFTY